MTKVKEIVSPDVLFRNLFVIFKYSPSRSGTMSVAGVNPSDYGSDAGHKAGN